MSLHRVFHDTILLTHPHYLHDAPESGSNVVVWFSSAEHGGARVPVCVVKVVEQRFVLCPQPHGRLTAVTGPCRMAGKTLFVFASSLAVCKDPNAAAPLPHKPAAFRDSIWPTLLCAGVVSTPELASVQPLLTIVNFTLPRRKRVTNVPVTIRCTTPVGEQEHSSAATGSDAEVVVILGNLTAHKTAHTGTTLLVDVQDVRVEGRDVQLAVENPDGANRWATLRSWYARVASLWRRTARYNVATQLDVATVASAHADDVEYPWPIAHQPRICITFQGSQPAFGLEPGSDGRA